jgi:flagellar capping protein FliD
MRFTGLTGMDTDAMVRQLMQAQSVRYNRIQQQRQLNLWRRESFHSVTQNLLDFQSNFLSMTARNSFRAPSTFHTFTTKVTPRTADTSASAISVRVENNVARSGSIKVVSVASADKRTGTRTMESDFKGNTTVNFESFNGIPANPGNPSADPPVPPSAAVLPAGISMAVTLDGSAARQVQLSGQQLQDIYDAGALDWDSELKTALEKALVAAGISQDRLSVSVTNGIISFNAAPGTSAQFSGAIGLARLGFTTTQPLAHISDNVVTIGSMRTALGIQTDGAGAVIPDTGMDLSFEITRNGVERNIVISRDAIANAATSEHVVDLINAELRTQFGSTGNTQNVRARMVGQRVVFESTTNQDFTLKADNHAVLGALGFNNTHTQTFTISDDFTNANMATMAGNSTNFNFKVNDDNIQFSIENFTTVNELITAANIELAKTNSGVTMIRQGDGIAFVISSNTDVTITGHDIYGNSLVDVDNNVQTNFTHTAVPPPLTLTAAATSANGRNGSTGIDLNTSLDVFLGMEIDGPQTININGRNITYTASTTMQEFMNMVNAAPNARMSFDTLSRRFTLESTQMGKANELRINAADDKALDIFRANGLGINIALGNGTDASVTITNAGGAETTITRESNSFTVDNLAITITEAAVGQTFDFAAQPNTDALMDTVRTFVDEYNKLVQMLHSSHMTARPRSGRYTFYEPLTEDQKQAMSDRDIDRWEEQAKIGMLHRDPTIRELHRMLRQWVSEPIEIKREDGTTRRISLFQIGITTTRNSHRDGGILEIDEARLRNFIENNGEDFTLMFTQRSEEAIRGNRNDRLRTGGISNRLDDIINWSTSALDRSSISLFSQAGLPGTDYSNSVLNRRIAEQDNRLESMRQALARKENQFFLMFSRMETALMQSNNQMGALMGMFGGF